MSYPSGKTPTLTRRGEPAPRSSGSGEEPLGLALTGAVRFRGDEVQSARAVRFDEGQLDQLALALAERMAAPKARWTFGELGALWLTRVRRVRVADEKRNVAQLHPLFAWKEHELTPAMISEWFNQLLEMGFSPVSVNKYRCAGRLIVRDAQANAQWGAANPFDLVKRLREPKRKYEMLSLDELRRVLPHLRPQERRMVRLTVHLGLRTGELFALQKSDVDFAAGVIHVRRSHGRATTKTGKHRTVPLLHGVAGDLMDAIRESPTSLVFPSADGGLKRSDSKMSRVLRTAMAAAGVVTGYAFTCRKPSCEYKIEFAGECADMVCPEHGWKLWRTPKVKAVRWYDLRHMAATFHRQAGADRLAVKLLLGHASDVTDDTYTHMGDDWARRELSRFNLDSGPSVQPVR